MAGCHPRLAEGRQYASGGPHTAQLGGCRTGVARSAASRPRWSTNQSRASAAACSSVPGSSNRWVAPGTTASRDSHRIRACARRLSSSTTASRPPTTSSVGARTSPSRGAARSGRPPRQTTAATSRVVGGRPQRRRRAGAGPEVPDRQAPAAAAGTHPGRHLGQPPGQQLDVEHVGAVALLARGEQVEQQRRQPGMLQHTGHVPVARAVPAAAAAVHEHDQTHAHPPARSGARQPHPPGGHLDLLVDHPVDGVRRCAAGSAAILRRRDATRRPAPAAPSPRRRRSAGSRCSTARRRRTSAASPGTRARRPHRAARAPRRARTPARPAPPAPRPAPAPPGTPPARSTPSRSRRRPPAPSGPPAPAAAGPPRNRRARRSTSARSRPSTSANSASLTCARRTTRSFTTSAPPSPTAPIASSGWNGTPSLRTTITSNGASSARATSAATGTPPRGNPSTTTSSPRRWRSRSASRRPASTRSLNGTTTPGPRVRPVSAAASALTRASSPLRMESDGSAPRGPWGGPVPPSPKHSRARSPSRSGRSTFRRRAAHAHDLRADASASSARCFAAEACADGQPVPGVPPAQRGGDIENLGGGSSPPRWSRSGPCRHAAAADWSTPSIMIWATV